MLKHTAKSTPWFLGAILILTLVGAAFAGDESQTLIGEYQWDQAGIDGELKAVFTPTGENQWDVSFHFDFRSEPHVYSGSAEGNLVDGTLQGEVKNENKKRTFTFTGSFEDGIFRGTHREITRGRAADTGTLTLGR